jgi:hypothetical protein
MPLLVTNDFPSFLQKLTLSSYSAEHCGHCFMRIILYAMRWSVKSQHRPSRFLHGGSSAIPNLPQQNP